MLLANFLTEKINMFAIRTAKLIRKIEPVRTVYFASKEARNSIIHISNHTECFSMHSVTQN